MNSLSRSEIFGISVFSILCLVWIINLTTGVIGHSAQRVSQENTREIEQEPKPSTILIHVDGAVENPGLIELPASSRIVDAIEKAGGAIQNADTDFLNLAETLLDGQKLYIPLEGEEIKSPLISDDAGIEELRKNIKSDDSLKTLSSPLNINTATLEQLMLLPGIGEVRAQNIIEYRNRHGGFKKKDDLLNVIGIGEGTYAKIKDMIYI